VSGCYLYEAAEGAQPPNGCPVSAGEELEEAALLIQGQLMPHLGTLIDAALQAFSYPLMGG
jgi:hypothetical protein